MSQGLDVGKRQPVMSEADFAKIAVCRRPLIGLARASCFMRLRGIGYDSQSSHESREQDAYGMQKAQADNRYFFQRYYTRKAIWERLIDPIGQESAVVQWFGEIVQGTL
jgi:hypothetical protein